MNYHYISSLLLYVKISWHLLLHNMLFVKAEPFPFVLLKCMIQCTLHKHKHLRQTVYLLSMLLNKVCYYGKPSMTKVG